MNDVSENIFSNNKYTIFIDQEIGLGHFQGYIMDYIIMNKLQ